MTINPRTSPKMLVPSTVRRKATIEQKATMRIRTIAEAIAEMSTMAISTGLGSTANDGSQPLTAGSVSFFACRKLPIQTGIAADK